MNPQNVPFIASLKSLMELVTSGYKGHVMVPESVSCQFQDVTAKQHADEALIDMTETEKKDLKAKNMWIGDLKTKPIPCKCGRVLNGYDLVLTGFKVHGAEFIWKHMNNGGVVRINKGGPYLICSNCQKKSAVPCTMYRGRNYNCAVC